MKLGIGSRLRLLGIMPDQGDLLTIKIIKELRDELALSEEEFKKYKIKSEGNQITWDSEVEDKDVKIGERGAEILVEALKELNESKSLTLADIDLWGMFVDK